MRASAVLGVLSVFPLLASASYHDPSHAAHARHARHAQRGLQSRADIERSISAYNKNAVVAKRANNVTDSKLDACPGYVASNVHRTAYSLSADLKLAGHACNVYGPDLTSLRLQVTYETGKFVLPNGRSI